MPAPVQPTVYSERDLLQGTEALKSLRSSDAGPHGLLRIGLAHALAEGTLIEPTQALFAEAAPLWPPYFGASWDDQTILRIFHLSPAVFSTCQASTP